jgi:hypothetical protein
LSLTNCRYVLFYHGGTADGVDFEADAGDLRSIKVKMGGARLIVSYPGPK